METGVILEARGNRAYIRSRDGRDYIGSRELFIFSDNGMLGALHLFQQRFGVLQVWSVEALGERVVDFSEHHLRLVALALLCQQARETCNRAQLPRLRVLLA